jgi:predicted Fe-Mo cluster-binding NifX family protein
MKIAAITDDGKVISQHFGRAPHYMVLTVEDGQIVARELRDKLNHAHFSIEGHTEGHGQSHGLDPASHNKHLQMSQSITDCEAVLCRGMGRGAYESMRMLGIRPIVTDIADIDTAVLAFTAGTITDQIERLH